MERGEIRTYDKCLSFCFLQLPVCVLIWRNLSFFFTDSVRVLCNIKTYSSYFNQNSIRRVIYLNIFKITGASSCKAMVFYMTKTRCAVGFLTKVGILNLAQNERNRKLSLFVIMVCPYWSSVKSISLLPIMDQEISGGLIGPLLDNKH